MYHYDERDLVDYQARMEGVRQFREFNISPQWKPGTGDVEGFCHDEVVRQYHNPRVRSDGGVRVDWMVAAWEYAQRASQAGLPTTHDILALGNLVEPHQNSTIGFRTMGVIIAGHHGAHPAKLKEFMAALVAQADVSPMPYRGSGPHPDEYRAHWGHFEALVRRVETADDWYLAYEAVHPFSDGNGRTGKILNNWLLGSLDEPILVRDYFNMGNP